MDEFKSKVEGNVTSFNNKYLTGKITLTGKIKSINDANDFISSDDFTCGVYNTEYYKKLVDIELEDDWILLTIRKDKDEVDIDNLVVGDTITVESNIANASVYEGEPFVYVHSDDGSHCKFGEDATKITKEE